MTTTERDLQALAYLAKRLREEAKGARKWDDAGLWSVLKKFEGHNLAITIERVTRHAGDVEAKTPGAIERPFVPNAPAAEVARPPKPTDCCRACGRQIHPPDVVCDSPTQRPPEHTADVTPQVARLRALLGRDDTDTSKENDR